jgi:hypothetical protein
MSEANDRGVQLRLARERAAERRSNGMPAMRLVRHRPNGASLRQSGHVGQVELATIGVQRQRDNACRRCRLHSRSTCGRAPGRGQGSASFVNRARRGAACDGHHPRHHARGGEPQQKRDCVSISPLPVGLPLIPSASSTQPRPRRRHSGARGILKTSLATLDGFGPAIPVSSEKSSNV